MFKKFKKFMAVVCASLVVTTTVPVLSPATNAAVSPDYERTLTKGYPTAKQVRSGNIIFSSAPVCTMYTTMECSVWSIPDSNNSANRVKKVTVDYPVNVYNQVIESPIDGKLYYQTIKGKYIMAKCLTPVMQVPLRQVGTEKMYPWGRTANGATIYENVAMRGATGEGWPQYMVDVIQNSGVTDSMTDYEKAVQLARYLSYLISYDYSHVNGSADYTTKGALTTHLVVCQGYANAYSNLLYMLGIESYYVRGQANGGNHGWNKLVIDGVEYYTDVTWNSCLRSDQYLMITFEQMSWDHYYKENRGRNFGDTW